MHRDSAPPSGRGRAVRSIIALVLAAPLMVGFWMWMGWFSLLLSGALVWVVWDYYRKGEMVWGDRRYWT